MRWGKLKQDETATGMNVPLNINGSNVSCEILTKLQKNIVASIGGISSAFCLHLTMRHWPVTSLPQNTFNQKMMSPETNHGFSFKSSPTQSCTEVPWNSQQFLLSGFEYVRIIIFCLFWGRLAVACILSRAQWPGIGLRRPLSSSAVANAAHEVLESCPHFLILVRVDAGVHYRVEYSQEQQPAF